MSPRKEAVSGFCRQGGQQSLTRPRPAEQPRASTRTCDRASHAGKSGRRVIQARGRIRRQTPIT